MSGAAVAGQIVGVQGQLAVHVPAHFQRLGVCGKAGSSDYHLIAAGLKTGFAELQPGGLTLFVFRQLPADLCNRHFLAVSVQSHDEVHIFPHHHGCVDHNRHAAVGLGLGGFFHLIQQLRLFLHLKGIFLQNELTGSQFLGSCLAGNTLLGSSFIGSILFGSSFTGGALLGNSFTGGALLGNSFAGGALLGNSFAGSRLLGHNGFGIGLVRLLAGKFAGFLFGPGLYLHHRYAALSVHSCHGRQQRLRSNGSHHGERQQIGNDRFHGTIAHPFVGISPQIIYAYPQLPKEPGSLSRHYYISHKKLFQYSNF